MYVRPNRRFFSSNTQTVFHMHAACVCDAVAGFLDFLYFPLTRVIHGVEAWTIYSTLENPDCGTRSAECNALTLTLTLTLTLPFSPSCCHLGWPQLSALYLRSGYAKQPSLPSIGSQPPPYQRLGAHILLPCAHARGVYAPREVASHAQGPSHPNPRCNPCAHSRARTPAFC